MILDHLYNLANIMNGYYVGDKQFETYLIKNQMEINKLKLNKLNKLNKLVGAGDKLQISVDNLEKSVQGLEVDMTNNKIDPPRHNEKIDEALEVASILVKFLRELYVLTNDEKLKQMEKQIQEMINLMDKY